MANISPFRAIRPSTAKATELVFEQVKIPTGSEMGLAGGDTCTLKELLEAGARIRPETEERQQQAYTTINNTFESLLASGQLWQEENPGIYVYEIVHPKYRQVGIWALTALSDYTDGKIKTHELTFTDSVRRLSNYRENTGLEGSPVLLTYQPSIAINRIIAETRKTVVKHTVGDRHCFHRIWKIEDIKTLLILAKAFAAIDCVYLADGHHRLAAAAKLGAKQRDENEPVFDGVSSLYIADDQLHIREFNRVFIPGSPLNGERFLTQLSEHFSVKKLAIQKPYQSRKLHQMGLFFEGSWYYLIPKVKPDKPISASMDTAILQQQLLAPLLGVTDPITDARLKYIGGDQALKEMVALLALQPEAIAFTLCPVTTNQLITIADAGEVLPPKSTWIDPKIPFGLLIHNHIHRQI